MEEINLAAFLPALVDGTNVLAVQMLNNAVGEEDFLFSAQLVTSNIPELTRAYLAQPTPGATNNVAYFLDRVKDTSFSNKTRHLQPLHFN